ncbi:glycoside hydrolase family 18 protein [Durotheca rogersii]|uniref:glycoside hydrolase family 18 protein n=1 Tax=Durotheca rogersii TaxID=419775 RepID=UPI00221F1CC9|nr:glycoside hydrolase family 18 protein [Durotheca rogersii]KAI5857422.1 glycoside hydrolase family 18 protein [Durotheca rogersii]
MVPALLLNLLAIWLFAMVDASAATRPRSIMYLTGQHPVTPDPSLSSSITHVALAFMSPDLFHQDTGESSWPLFMSVSEARSKFRAGTKIMVAIGGWGDTAGFEAAARTEDSRAKFARSVASMVHDTGADGVDIDWEYPGGNGEDYKTIPNEDKAWQVAAYPELLAEIRKALGPDIIISAAVPGLPKDMLAFTAETVPRISESLDFLNVMTYDLMNRRDNVTGHHTGVQSSLTAVRTYIANGAARDKINLGFAFYVRYFRTGNATCLPDPIGCPTGPMEDPRTGADLGKAGSFSWHDAVPRDVRRSFEKALTEGQYDQVGGGYWYWDEIEAIWWTFDTPDAITKKFPLIIEREKLGGVFAWGLGEDAPRWSHLKSLNAGVEALVGKEEL